MTAPVETTAGSAPAEASATEPVAVPVSEPGGGDDYGTLDAVRAVTLARSLADRAEAARIGFASAGADVPGDVVQALTDLPELARFVAATVTQTATDGRYTEAGRKDANAKVLAEPVIRKLGNIAAQVAAAQAADDEQQAQQAKAARNALVPTTEFEKLRALEIAKAARESGKNSAERIPFANRLSAEGKATLVFIGPEVSGYDPEFLSMLAEHLTPQDQRQAREQHTLARARRDRVLQHVRDLQALAVGVSDAAKLVRERVIPKRGRDMSKEQRIEYYRQHKSHPEW